MRLKSLLAVSLVCWASVAAWGAREWTFPGGTNSTMKVAHDEALNFMDGFKASIRFACDLEKIGSSRFSNLVTKGKDFTDGWSIMVKKDGDLLVYLKGIRGAYRLSEAEIQSNQDTLLEVYVLTNSVRVFVNGREKHAYLYTGRRKMGARPTPMHIGSMGGYSFNGRLYSVRLEPISEVTLPPGGPRPVVIMPAKNQARAEILWQKNICVQEDRYIGWPSVCRLANGDLLAVFSGDRDEHVCPWGKVQMIRSTDNGETWSRPVTIANGPIDDRDAGIVQLPDGEIFVTYFTSLAYRTKKFLTHNWPRTSDQYWWRRHDEKLTDEVRQESVGNFAVRSKDNGRTWSKPEKLSLKGQTPHGPILLRDGSLFQIGRSFTRSGQGKGERGRTIISAERSTDGGRTWEVLCGDIPDTNGENTPDHMFHEPHAVELADGTLIGLVRYHGPDHCMRQTVSRDGGRTWTPMTKTAMIGLPPHLIELPDGKVVNVYGRRHVRPGYGEFAAISDDRGATWDTANEIALAHSHNGDLGYPASCLLPDGCILTVYYQQPEMDKKPCLMATKWRVK